jgi:hypothetical protein
MDLVPSVLRFRKMKSGECKMFKRTLVALLVAQLVITPVQAKQECTKAFVGIDDLIIIVLSSLMLVYIGSNAVEKAELRKKLEQEKAKQPAPNSCLL